MGPIRRGLAAIFLLGRMSGAAWAGVCEDVYPNWNGDPVSAFDQAIALGSSALSLVLLIASALAVRLRRQWGALAVVLAWSTWITVLTFVDPMGTKAEAIKQGCRGPDTLFIAFVTAICVAMILYTLPRQERSD